jgi:hypothetical protein
VDYKVSMPGRDKEELFPSPLRAASYPMGTGDSLSGVKRSETKLTTRSHLVSILRMCRAVPPFHHTSWRGIETTLPLPDHRHF